MYYSTKNKKSQQDNERIISKIGKYNAKKKKCVYATKYLKKYISEKMLERCECCGEVLKFATEKDKGKKKTVFANHCGNRFCPLCRWREAMGNAVEISALLKYLKKEHKMEFIFITFTAPNVPKEELKKSIDRFNLALKNLMKRKDVSEAVKGYLRKLELTCNRKRESYHPHFHCLIAVNHSYFTDETYIKREKWLEMWREVMGDYDINQVDVRKLRNGDNMNSIMEIATYAAKDEDLYENGQEVFDGFYEALKGRQIITYSGVFAMAHKLYKTRKLDEYIEQDTTEYTHILIYEWDRKEAKYVEIEFRELEDWEKKKVNKVKRE
jgi:plasmid rolling circle replication initiator protein Rep